MSTISGRYVARFADADVGMLEGVSLNAPYPFFWVRIRSIERDVIVCTAAGQEMRLPYRRLSHGDRAKVTVQDPIFGPIEVEVVPFLEGKPRQGGLFA